MGSPELATQPCKHCVSGHRLNLSTFDLSGATLNLKTPRPLDVAIVSRGFE